MISIAFFATIVAMASYGIRCWKSFANQKESVLGGTQTETSTADKPFGFVDMALLVFAWMGSPAIIILLAPLYYEVDKLQNLSQPQMAVAMFFVSAVQLTTCLLAIAIYAARYGSLDRSLGLSWDKLRIHSVTAFKWFSMTIPAILCLQAALAILTPYDHETLNQLQEHFSLSTVLFTWFGATIVAPVCEELIFRGILQGWLQRFNQRRDPENALLDIVGGWPVEPIGVEARQESEFKNVGKWDRRFWLPIFISSGLFAAIHVGQGAAPIALFFFGLVLGYLYRKTGSLIPCIILHFMLNAFSMFWTTIQTAFSGIVA